MGFDVFILPLHCIYHSIPCRRRMLAPEEYTWPEQQISIANQVVRHKRSSPCAMAYCGMRWQAFMPVSFVFCVFFLPHSHSNESSHALDMENRLWRRVSRTICRDMNTMLEDVMGTVCLKVWSLVPYTHER